ncbi:MAG: hypothetical protein IH934_06890 [Nanoarchaeota archaeon]|nr:hypothetical protein [Nanoarchaeota archaeon]
MNRKIKHKKITSVHNDKLYEQLKIIFILLWILIFYIVHYYFEIKRYFAYVPEHISFLF